MTLIASFEFQHVPVLLGDMLITSPGAPTKESHTPLVHTPNKIIDLKEARYVSSLRQKLAILHDHVCLAWAGDLFHAQRFAEYIRSFASGVVSIDYDELRRTIDAYPREEQPARRLFGTFLRSKPQTLRRTCKFGDPPHTAREPPRRRV
jgi:hypothetical protein